MEASDKLFGSLGNVVRTGDDLIGQVFEVRGYGRVSWDGALAFYPKPAGAGDEKTQGHSHFF